MNKEEILISDIKEKFDTLGVARSLAISDDDRILDFLLKDSKYSQEYKERFFKEHSLALVFKKDDFLNFLDLKLLNSSYTSFSNKIGLGTKAKRFIKNDENVVLNFPFKDGVLKGGQSKDDEKSNEIFFNNVLAKSDIDALFSPKVLTNFELLGEGDIKEVLKNNPSLLIKGNNLIALHTLKEYFRHQSEQNKVKLIYIDPPYNTGNDDFKYNDKFKHSTWLCFMKNRLEIARELLRDDGVIFVQCDDNEQAYLKVLMDEIFGRENFVCNLIPLMNPRGRQESAYPIAKSHEYILCYSKKEDAATFFNFGITKNEEISDEIRLLSLRKSGNASLRKDRPNMFYPIFYNTKTNLIYTKQTNDEFEIAIYPIKTNGDEGRWRWQKSNVENNIDLLVCKKNSKDEYDIYVKDYIIKDGQTRGEKTKTFVIDKNIINDKAKEHLEQLFNNKECFSYPKSEYLLQRILEISTQENDLVLDFFAGSGTTMAVAHKMKRRCITIEQMDYIQTITKERIKKVIEGEQGGISKAVEWQGGGNLVYCELASLNAKFIEQIENCSNENELNNIYEALRKLAFIDYRADIQSDFKDLEFGALSFEEKKRILKKCLDRNMDYIPYADIEDSEYKIDEQTRILNKIFYKKS